VKQRPKAPQIVTMAFLPGLKKQINKANQYMTERITGVEGTRLDTEFQEMERRTDLFNELVDDLQIKTKEFLQPNPTVRVKMSAVKGISKLSGQAKASTYPQPEGTLGDAMSSYGRKLQDFDNNSVYSAALIESGEALKQMADLKYALDDNVKQNYLEPMHHTQTKDLKEVLHHRKKLQGRKLDFDCKKRKGEPDEVLRAAEEKFAESLQLAQLGMHNLLDGSGVEHISQLTQFAESLLEYHKKMRRHIARLDGHFIREDERGLGQAPLRLPTQDAGRPRDRTDQRSLPVRQNPQSSAGLLQQQSTGGLWQSDLYFSWCLSRTVAHARFFEKQSGFR